MVESSISIPKIDQQQQDEISFNDIFKKDLESKNLAEKELAIYGCVLGAFIGDAAGSLVEFKKKVSNKEADESLKMVGKGPFRLGPGQITDDSELAMCIIHGLIDKKLRTKNISAMSDEDQKSLWLNLDGITYYFGKWLNGSPGPFDIGETTRNAFCSIKYIKDPQEFILQSVFFDQMEQTKTCNQNSQSNGCLMRLTPLAVFCHNLPKESIKRAVYLQTILSHSNSTSFKACYLYCFAISILINERNPEKAYEETKKEAADLEKKPNEGNEKKGKYDKDNIYYWFLELEKKTLPKTYHQMGYLKIAFVYAFYYLRRFCQAKDSKKTDFYAETMRKIIKLGGDTDTNACIVGGLIGACVGAQNIRTDMINAVLDFDCNNPEQTCKKRPEFLIPKHHLIEKIKYIAENAPSKLIVQANNKIECDKDLDQYIKIMEQ